MLDILAPLLNAKTCSLNLTLTASNGNLELILLPACCTIDNDEVTALKAALSLPIKVVGNSASDITLELRQYVKTCRDRRSQWEQQLVEAEEAIAKARSKSKDAKKPIPATEQAKPTKAETVLEALDDMIEL